MESEYLLYLQTKAASPWTENTANQVPSDSSLLDASKVLAEFNQWAQARKSSTTTPLPNFDDALLFTG